MARQTKTTESNDSISKTTEIISAYVSNNKVAVDELPRLFHEIYATVDGISNGQAGLRATTEPAVPIEKSVTPDFVICLEDGKKLKMLKRYLRTHFDLSPEDYRRKWGLPADYPMVAPNYAKRRSQFAKDIGLGTAANTKPRRTTTKKRGTKAKKR